MFRSIMMFVTALSLGFCSAAMAQAAVDPASVDLKQIAHPFFVFSAAGIVGMVGHYLKKWTRNEIQGSIVDYFVRDHGRASLAALGGFLGTAGTMALSHQLDGMNEAQTIFFGLTTGFSFDSGLNKGSQPTWQ